MQNIIESQSCGVGNFWGHAVSLYAIFKMRIKMSIHVNLSWFWKKKIILSIRIIRLYETVSTKSINS